jgi:DNA-binding response OmpR family regulator
LCIFDIMMPKMDGFDLAEKVRQIDAEVPIIFLSAKTLKEDRIKGLRLGADDYLVKPFSIEELLLKIEIFLKRSQKTTTTNEKVIYTVGKYQFDSKNYLVFTETEKISLTQREAELLKLFLDNKNVVMKREEILKSLWGNDDYFMGRSLDVFISRLRKILANEKGIAIENLHGIGFKFSVE